jgi:DNA repair protein RecO (recombination protein O)
MMLADLVDEMWSERDAAPSVFPWVVAAWQELTAGSNPLTLTLTASWQLLRLAGYFPQWRTCSVCGKCPVAGPVWIDPEHGTMLCSTHRGRSDTETSLSLGALRTWQQWMNLEVGKIGQYEAKGVIASQLFSLFRLYVQGHIGRLPRSLQFLMEVENMVGEGEDRKS